MQEPENSDVTETGMGRWARQGDPHIKGEEIRKEGGFLRPSVATCFLFTHLTINSQQKTEAREVTGSREQTQPFFQAS